MNNVSKDKNFYLLHNVHMTNLEFLQKLLECVSSGKHPILKCNVIYIALIISATINILLCDLFHSSLSRSLYLSISLALSFSFWICLSLSHSSHLVALSGCVCVTLLLVVYHYVCTITHKSDLSWSAVKIRDTHQQIRPY